LRSRRKTGARSASAPSFVSGKYRLSFLRSFYRMPLVVALPPAQTDAT
jgi:hypothetical protein